MPKTNTQTVARLLREYGQRIALRRGNPSRSKGRVAAVACDSGHHFSKRRRDSILLVAGHGIENDAHAGPHVRHRYLARRNSREPNLRQVHLIPSELFAALEKRGFSVSAGDLGENITTSGIDLEQLPAGALLSLDCPPPSN